jgi:hypothetical protein
MSSIRAPSAVPATGSPDSSIAPAWHTAVVTTVLFVFSMTLIPILERLFIRDLIRRGEREGRKIEAVR